MKKQLFVFGFIFIASTTFLGACGQQDLLESDNDDSEILSIDASMKKRVVKVTNNNAWLKGRSVRFADLTDEDVKCHLKLDEEFILETVKRDRETRSVDLRVWLSAEDSLRLCPQANGKLDWYLYAGSYESADAKNAENEREHAGSKVEFGAVNTLNPSAIMPTNPVTDPDFIKLPNNKKLTDLSASGSRLSLTRGKGNSFSSTAMAAYKKLKSESQTNLNHKVQWVLMDLDSHQIIEQSMSPNRKIFGASSSKIFVAGALLDKQGGTLTSSQWQKMADMLVVSSNEAWVDLQAQIGDGNPNLGRERIHKFTQRMGYLRMRGFQGTWNNMHGNELTAVETAEFLHDTYKARYPGAEILWKLMHTCRTGTNRGLKYIPPNIYVGAKTGTYDGPTVNPETGKTTNTDGSSHKVAVRNHMMIFYVNGKQFALTILADTGSDESAALLAGGLIREYGNL